MVDVLNTWRIPADDVVTRWAGLGIRSALIQYVPFLYAGRGLSRFPEALARAARAEGIRVTVFVHEPWVPPTRPLWKILSPLQRRQLLRLVKHVDRVVTPVPTWAELLGGAEILHVGSTLGDPPDPLPPAARHPVVFSPFAAGLHWAWITAAVESIRATPPLVVIGADANAFRAHRGVGRWWNAGWSFRGRLPASDALGEIAAGRVALAPFEDGMTGRRTSALALASTGIRVLGSTGHLHDPFFDPLVETTDTRDAFAAAAAQADDGADARARRREWYRSHLDPAELDRRLAHIMVSG